MLTHSDPATQLPALISTGKTKGVTIVISPLVSLIQDQVRHLCDLGIPSIALLGEMLQSAKNQIFATLNGPDPHLRLLYVTPEMVVKSHQMRGALRTLYNNERLARFVIDEAHCVSQWGHDFRPDYKQLSQLKSDFPRVPIMAMTATATRRVRLDVRNVLNIREATVLEQSFNRPNLLYEVRKKGSNVLLDIANFIKNKHEGECGIIYCSSRRACEETADKLKTKYNISSTYYHAGLGKNDRMTFQTDWQKGKVQVIVATVAFGMGIDKGDVRFVIHHTIPQSLEGYYQETGRAGRDGKISECVLYFAPRDVSTVRRMIEDGSNNANQKQQQLDNLNRVVSYCYNTYDCRRQQVLRYFDEEFSPKDCHQTCDNCRRDTGELEEKDFTEHAKQILELMPNLTGHVTLQHCVDVYRGSRKRDVVDRGHLDVEHAGKGASLNRNDLERLFYVMLGDKALEEYSWLNGAGYAQAYIKVS